jgi:hypothetical protein
MNSLAITDGLLLVVTVYLALQRHLPIALRLACGVFGAAALLGVLRFSGVYPLPSWHQFASMLGAASAFPLLAVVVLWPDSLAARNTRFAWIVLCITAVIGVIVVGVGQKRIYSDALALLSLLAVCITLVRTRQWLGALGGILMLAALVLFALKISAGSLLVPGDLLHIGMAAGLLLLSHMKPTETVTVNKHDIDSLSVVN